MNYNSNKQMKIDNIRSVDLSIQNSKSISFEPDIHFGHHISIDDLEKISCTLCGKQEEMPEIFKSTDPHTQVMYKLYMLSKFKEAVCTPSKRLVNTSSLQLGTRYLDNIFVGEVDKQ